MRSLTINHYCELFDRIDHKILYHLCADTVCVVSNCLNHLHHIHIHHISIIPLLFLIVLLLFVQNTPQYLHLHLDIVTVQLNLNWSWCLT